MLVFSLFLHIRRVCVYLLKCIGESNRKTVDVLFFLEKKKKISGMTSSFTIFFFLRSKISTNKQVVTLRDKNYFSLIDI